MLALISSLRRSGNRRVLQAKERHRLISDEKSGSVKKL